MFGIGGQGGSAVSFDRLMFKSMARVRTERREIEGIHPEVLDASERRRALVIADPFASVAERAAMVREDLRRVLLT